MSGNLGRIWNDARCRKPNPLVSGVLLLMGLGLCCLSCLTQGVSDERQALPGEDAPDRATGSIQAAAGSRAETPSTPVAKASIHRPYAARKCELCHDSENSNHLRMGKEALCRLCHPADKFIGRVTHSPVSQGDCCACHSPHKSVYSNLLRDEVPLICGSCHKKESLETLEVHRADGGRECLRCHLVHFSENDHLLKQTKGGVETP